MTANNVKTENFSLTCSGNDMLLTDAKRAFFNRKTFGADRGVDILR